MKKTKRIFLVALFVLSGIAGFAQNIPVFRQFYFNPYFFNPAYVGISGKMELSLAYRQQWVDVTDAPAGTGFTFQLPTANRAAFGFNFVSQEVVALRNSTASFTFGYKVPIAEDHSLRMGISFGLGMYRLNLDNLDYSNDPTILNAANKTIYPSGNFGLLYSYKNLKAGVALPEIFGINHVSNSDKLNVFRNQFYSLSYTFNVSAAVDIEPYALYRVTGDYQNFWEFSTVVSWKEKVWTGVSYRQFTGLGLMLGFRAKDIVGFSYSYEFQPTSRAFIGTSSHELHFNIFLKNMVDDDEPEIR
jgi:type IX secretion system PorP/SprF family membrane protein